MKLNWDDSVLRLIHEGIANFASLSDFDKNTIENLSSVWKNSIPDIEADPRNSTTAEAYVAVARISSILVRRRITVFNAANHYGSISRVMSPQNMVYTIVLEIFNIEHEDYLSIKDDYDSNVPKINNKKKI